MMAYYLEMPKIIEQQTKDKTMLCKKMMSDDTEQMKMKTNTESFREERRLQIGRRGSR